MTDQPNLFTHMQTLDELLAAIESKANKICDNHVFAISHSKSKAYKEGRSVNFVSFEGTTKSGQRLWFNQSFDGFHHCAFMLDEFLKTVK